MTCAALCYAASIKTSEELDQFRTASSWPICLDILLSVGVTLGKGQAVAACGRQSISSMSHTCARIELTLAETVAALEPIFEGSLQGQPAQEFTVRFPIYVISGMIPRTVPYIRSGFYNVICKVQYNAFSRIHAINFLFFAPPFAVQFCTFLCHGDDDACGRQCVSSPC